MRAITLAVLKVLLLMVIFAEAHSIVQANINTEKYLAVFPAAHGVLFYLSQVTSLAALLNCVMIWLRKKWAVWTNLVIGGWSIMLVQLLAGPAVNQLIILSATLGIFILSMLVQDWFNPGQHADN